MPIGVAVSVVDIVKKGELKGDEEEKSRRETSDPSKSDRLKFGRWSSLL